MLSDMDVTGTFWGNILPFEAVCLVVSRFSFSHYFYVLYTNHQFVFQILVLLSLHGNMLSPFILVSTVPDSLKEVAHAKTMLKCKSGRIQRAVGFILLKLSVEFKV